MNGTYKYHHVIISKHFIALCRTNIKKKNLLYIYILTWQSLKIVTTFYFILYFLSYFSQVEKRVESIGHACKKTSTKLKDCLLGQGQDAEKRTVRAWSCIHIQIPLTGYVGLILRSTAMGTQVTVLLRVL